MSLRSFIGLCEHRWQDEAEIVRSVANPFRESSNDPATAIVGFRRVQRCSVCGKVRSVAL
jgi:hypothetical protein